MNAILNRNFNIEQNAFSIRLFRIAGHFLFNVQGLLTLELLIKVLE